MEKKVLNSMFDNLLHIGNKKNYWNPNMREYIYGNVNGVYVFNLIKTGEKIKEVQTELKSLVSEGKKILFVATKLQARDPFVKLAEETGHFYVSEKWVPGLLTNFKTIKKRISYYLKLIKDSESGALDSLTKKEKAKKLLELEKLDKAYRGLKEIKKVPDIVFAVDGAYEVQSIKEANSLNLKVYSISNTNGDDTIVDNIIPANTNSVKSLEFISSGLSSVLSGIKVSAPKKNPVKKTYQKPKFEEKKVVNKDSAKKEVSKKDEKK
ncbi:30S ribosomal protein S2 [Candidatus Gracilibacteria bacterium]|nr:MAG: 30S ribosomal protein S2 [Candidatus Gracilibacteria bacterium]